MTGPEVAVEKKLQGIAASPGIIIGKAHLVENSKVKIVYQYLVNDGHANEEVKRFKKALRTAEEQLITLRNKMPDQAKDYAFILDSHLMILKDSMLKDSTIQRILDEKINAEWALKKTLQEIQQIFAQIDDEYIRSRINDVDYVTERILRNLSGETRQSLAEIKERVIIVAHDLSPADTTELNTGKVMGFITDVGGRTSHTAIMAQALEIPAVAGLGSITDQLEEGELLIVDGNTGEVILDPDDNTIIFYQEKQLKYKAYKASIDRTSHLPAETLDNHRVSVKANIEFLEEVAAAKDHGGEGIGLYRTEFLYLRNRWLPSEEELFEDYREVAEIIAPETVTIRTVDLGGDKLTSGIETTHETNPALGLRGIRICLKKPEIFKSQLSAILRASIYGKIQLMFPMISGLQEILDAKEILAQVKNRLDQKDIEYDHDIKVGIMIEIPSAVTMAEELANHVDFFSIGTNDLIQYALAIDRVNEYVAHIYQPFDPAILRMIRQVVEAAKKADISVSLCGEMAGDPLCAYMLLGLDLVEFSMNSTSIPLIKSVIRSISVEEARLDVQNALRLTTAGDVQKHVLDRMKSIAPELLKKGYLNS